MRHACRISLPTLALALVFIVASSAPALAAGTLTAQGSPDQPVRIHDHRVQVVINNGFSQTEVIQTFYNPNPYDVEAIYSFPLPKSASLSEVTVKAGETEIHGEVVEAQKAEDVYTAEKDRGRRAALATQDGYQAFEFRVAPVPAEGDVEIRFVYYQPIEIDTGIGRYLYPLEEGGTDAAAEAFWLRHDKVDGLLTIDVELRSAYPVADVRAPGLEGPRRSTSWTRGTTGSTSSRWTPPSTATSSSTTGWRTDCRAGWICWPIATIPQDRAPSCW